MVRWPPSSSPYSSSMVSAVWSLMALATSSKTASPESRRAPCQKKTSPGGMKRSRRSRRNSSRGAWSSAWVVASGLALTCQLSSTAIPLPTLRKDIAR
jgi:hypothetical protein